MSDWKYSQVVQTLEAKGIDVGKYRILIDFASLDGEPISGASLSQNGDWVCLPVIDEEAEGEEYQYRPQCYEVAGRYDIWVSNNWMAYKTDVALLYRR